MQSARTPPHVPRVAVILTILASLLLSLSCAARSAATSTEEDTLVVSPEPPMVLKVDKSFVYAGEVSIGPEETGEPMGLALTEQVFFDVDEGGRIRRAITIGTMAPPEGAAFNELIWVPTEQLVYGGEIFGGVPFRGRTVAVPVDQDFYLRERAGENGFKFPALLLVRELGLLVDDTGVFLISYAEAVEGKPEDWESVETLDDARTNRVLGMSARLRGSIVPVMPENSRPAPPAGPPETGEEPLTPSRDPAPDSIRDPARDPARSPV